MKFFNPEQRLTILGATDMQTVLDDGTVYDERNSARGSGSQLSAKYGSTSSGTPARETVVITSGNQAPQNGFECPLPGAGDCFERIPREDITETLSFQVGSSGSNFDGDVDLDNVRGMRLCSIEGLLIVNPAGAPGDFTDYELHQTLVQAGWESEFSIEFRGQKVPGFKDISLAPFIALPGCCDTKKICVDCTIPQQGGMEIVTNLDDVYSQLSSKILSLALEMKLHFSGCGCNCSDQNCGCK